MHKYRLGNIEIDSIELKCLLISKGMNVRRKVYKDFSDKKRIYPNPLMCNCIILPDGTIVQMTDLSFHFSYLKGALSWDNLRLLRYAPQMKTPFSLESYEDGVVLCYNNEFVCNVSFPQSTDFYSQKTSSGLPYVGNAVIQGTQWVAFQCLWPCEYACAGESCQFCYSGGG